MKTSGITTHKRNCFLYVLPIAIILGGLLFETSPLYSEDKSRDKSSEKTLLSQYIDSKGNDIILFDASNIKQFWTDKSIYCKGNAIFIQLERTQKGFKSLPLKIQLINVIETQDCKIEVVADDPNLFFSVTDDNLQSLTDSQFDFSFVQDYVFSATVHLEDTNTFSFNLLFSSETSDCVQIKKIILSFSLNQDSHFAGSPGFERLLNLFETEGVNVPNNDIQYIVPETSHKLFIKIPNSLVSKYKYSFHIYPVDKKDLLPDRVQYEFNNLDFNLFSTSKNKKNIIIPKPYSVQSDYTIIQCPLPSYQYSLLKIGQFEGRTKFWEIVLP